MPTVPGQPTREQDAETAPPPEPCSGVYRNEQYRFTLQCPAGGDWIVRAGSYEPFYARFRFTPLPLSEWDRHGTGYAPIFLSFYHRGDNETLEVYYHNKCSGEVACSASTDLLAAADPDRVFSVKIAGTDGVKFLNPPRGPVPSTIISFIHDQYVVEITKHHLTDEARARVVDEAFELITGTLSFY